MDCPAVAIEFDVLDRVGEGTFSSVYKARSRARTSEYYALKHIYVNSAPSRIENEVAFLDELGYGPRGPRARRPPPRHSINSHEPNRATGSTPEPARASGRHNVVRLIGGIRHRDSVLLILEHFENDDIRVIAAAPRCPA